LLCILQWFRGGRVDSGDRRRLGGWGCERPARARGGEPPPPQPARGQRYPKAATGSSISLTALARSCLAVAVCSAGLAWAQAAAPPTPDAAQLAKLFGPAFQPLPGIPVLTADFDGDGAEDAVVAATAANPLADQVAFHYKVIDPYSSYFGLGDPEITVHFAGLGEKPRVLLVVHNWRAPKMKFVVLNFPFDKLAVSSISVKKKTLAAIRAEDLAGIASFLYWDGKRWKWKEGE
jgi:hypothetical protein